MCLNIFQSNLMESDKKFFITQNVSESKIEVQKVKVDRFNKILKMKSFQISLNLNKIM